MREEVTGGWRQMHNEHHNLYTSPDIINKVAGVYGNEVSESWSSGLWCHGILPQCCMAL
jgi:hypothetical protein